MTKAIDAQFNMKDFTPAENLEFRTLLDIILKVYCRTVDQIEQKKDFNKFSEEIEKLDNCNSPGFDDFKNQVIEMALIRGNKLQKSLGTLMSVSNNKQCEFLMQMYGSDVQDLMSKNNREFLNVSNAKN